MGEADREKEATSGVAKKGLSACQLILPGARTDLGFQDEAVYIICLHTLGKGILGR